MFEGKKVLILDVIIFSLSFIFVFWLSKTNFILDFVVWFGGWALVTVIHEIGHSFICAVSGGFPLIVPGSFGGGFTLFTHCVMFVTSNAFVEPILTVFGIIFECISIFIFFYLAAATNEKSINGLLYSFISSTFAWVNVGLLQREITYTVAGSDVSELISIPGITINTIITSIASMAIILVIIALRYGLEEEQKNNKINVINSEVLPPDISYTNFFLISFFILCSFIGVSILIQAFQPNIIGLVLIVIMILFSFYLYNIYKTGRKFKQIVTKVKINLKAIKTSYSFLSAIFQCTTEKDVVFSIVCNKQGWTLNVPLKNISVKLPDFVSAEDVAVRIDRIFSCNKLL